MKKAPILTGSVVISTAGRDEGRTFLVVDSLDELYVLISDGKPIKWRSPRRRSAGI